MIILLEINSVAISPYKNLLLNPDISDPSWSKSYNKNIVYTYDGPNPQNKTVATFNDAVSGNSQTYWYCYTDQSPQEANTTYVVEIWVLIEEGTANILFYTSDNTEASTYSSNARYTSPAQAVSAAEGWKKLTWEFTTPSEWYSDSLSFNITGGTWGANDKTMSLSAPFITTKELYDEVDIYTERQVLIQVDLTAYPITYDEIANSNWDGLEVNIWNDLDLETS